MRRVLLALACAAVFVAALVVPAGPAGAATPPSTQRASSNVANGHAAASGFRSNSPSNPTVLFGGFRKPGELANECVSIRFKSQNGTWSVYGTTNTISAFKFPYEAASEWTSPPIKTPSAPMYDYEKDRVCALTYGWQQWRLPVDTDAGWPIAIQVIWYSDSASSTYGAWEDIVITPAGGINLCNSKADCKDNLTRAVPYDY